MYLCATGTAVPPIRYTKAQCLEAFLDSAWYGRLQGRSVALTRLLLERDNGIEARHLSIDALPEVFEIEPDILARRFARHAPQLAARAAQRALSKAGIEADCIDAVVVSTCTGYLCPGLSGYVVEHIGLRADVQAFDLVGQGCAAALPNLDLGRALIAGGCNHVLSVCVEVSSAAMYLDDDPGVLVSACLFGDGAGAAVLSRRPGRGRSVRWTDMQSVMVPAQRDALRFESRGGMLRNVLTREVPALAADHAHRLLGDVLSRHSLRPGDIRCWVMHAGGRDVLDALSRRFEVGPDAFSYSRAMLREYGNLSSAFVYFVLEAALDDDAPDGWWWMSSFGAGFACHGALLEVAS